MNRRFGRYIRTHKGTLLLVYVAVVATASLVTQVGLGDTLHRCIFG